MSKASDKQRVLEYHRQLLDLQLERDAAIHEAQRVYLQKHHELDKAAVMDGTYRLLHADMLGDDWS